VIPRKGGDFAVRNADVIFSRHAGLEAAKKFREDIVARTLKAGRPADDVKIFPGQEFILAPTAKEAEDKLQWVRERQVGPQTAIAFLEQFWGRALTEYDPDGPLPDVDPVVDVTDPTRGNAFHGKNARELAAEWRAEATEKGQSIRQFVSGRAQLNGRGLVGSYDDVADLLAEYAHSGAVDGFNITPWIVPSGLDDIVNELVPRLQDRGVYRTEYEATTLRENLGLRAPLSHRSASLASVGTNKNGEVA
jgi:alkanesulfonate monooxygenase SsuD/methylene tetrahydromethanopterin reductase-like flavin-dependent oxidoreductase (luciferase family)